MSQIKIKLNAKQIAFVTSMVDISEPNAAVERFIKIMREEGLLPTDISKIVDILMERSRK